MCAEKGVYLMRVPEKKILGEWSGLVKVSTLSAPPYSPSPVSSFLFRGYTPHALRARAAPKVELCLFGLTNLASPGSFPLRK